ncbi:MAG TPA: tetraacyldisaccharide 4'-kinase [Pyrinomonadaceae bacterium]|jgi:tetraacyldisaccharide 4'-kinase
MPFSWIYARIADFRNTLFERGAFESFALGAPAVSIGNITVGGTGKTPLVAFAARVFAEEGAKVCILTRGYGRDNPRERVTVSDGERILADARQAGDEPLELAKKLLGSKTIVVADADRVAAAKWAIEKFGANAFVLDDAFQHRRARRDLDVVLLDATNPFGNRKTLPFGILREPLENLKRADLFILTRADLVDETQITSYKLQITKFNPAAPIITAANKTTNLIELEDFLSNIQPTADRRPPTADHCLAFCALGNPENFFEQLRRENFDLAATHKFPDHHRYTQDDVAGLEKTARRNGAQILLTTAKDAVKLSGLKFEMPCFVVESALVFDDEKKLRRIVGAVLTKNPKSKI